ncbi:MAG: TIGR04282 family arsenosugar biosynthesis glycosyltransferase [Bermanella sp.]
MKLDCMVIQFAKYPRKGEVKTRLKPLLEDDGCYQLHQQLLTKVNENIRKSGIFNVLALDQLGQHEAVDNIASHSCLLLQQGLDLGERMKNALHWGLERAHKVIIVGSDCPVIKPSHLQEVAEKLNSSDHVFIPAEDGGYVLIAANEVFSPIFENMPWGGDQVMVQTRDKLSKANKTVLYLSSLWDVDRPDDYQRLTQLYPHWPNT